MKRSWRPPVSEFGHTGHAIELLAHGELRHEAVAIGMIAISSRFEQHV